MQHPSQDISDEALCLSAAQGDPDAEETLVVRYRQMVRACARPYFLAGGDSEDLIQEGMVGLLKAIREYDTTRAASFRTFAETCIRNRLFTAIRAAGREKHTPLNHSLSFETPLFQGNSDHYAYGPELPCSEDPEELLIGQEAYRERLGELKGQLSGFEAEILVRYLRGLSYAEIADEVDRSPKSVDNAVQRIRRKLAQQLTSGDFSQG